MLLHLCKKLAYGLLVLFLVTITVSTIINLSPVDPTRLTFGQRLDEESVELKRKQLGLDLPLYRQVMLYCQDVSPIYIGSSASWRELYGVAFLDIGQLRVGLKTTLSQGILSYGPKCLDNLKRAFPNTLYLATLSIGVATIIGILLGIMAAASKGTWLDHSIVFLSTIGFSVPSYVTAIVLAVLFGYYWGDFTGLNIQGSLVELNDLGEETLALKNLILPAIALGIRPIAIVTQLMRSSMLQILHEKFVIAARAKGVDYKRLLSRHVVRNALNPVVTALSGWFAALLAGAFFVEFIFNYKGIGFVTVNALLNYDIPVVLGALIFTSALFIIINILVDLSYAALDPRITLNH